METRPPSLLPEQFGALQGVRILSSGSLIAQPYAAALAAEMGAEVIQVERPGEGDAAWRHLGRQLPTTDGTGKAATTWIQERRNEFYITLDFSKPAFLPLNHQCEQTLGRQITSRRCSVCGRPWPAIFMRSARARDSRSISRSSSQCTIYSPGPWSSISPMGSFAAAPAIKPPHS